MAKKTNDQLKTNLEEITSKRKVESRFSMVRGITDCQSLGEIQTLVNSLVADYGVDAKVHFDSGHSNISEDLIVMRDETDAEVNARIDKEVTELLRKQTAANKQATDLIDQIEKLRSAKVQ